MACLAFGARKTVPDPGLPSGQYPKGATTVMATRRALALTPRAWWTWWKAPSSFAFSIGARELMLAPAPPSTTRGRPRGRKQQRPRGRVAPGQGDREFQPEVGNLLWLGYGKANSTPLSLLARARSVGPAGAAAAAAAQRTRRYTAKPSGRCWTRLGLVRRPVHADEAGARAELVLDRLLRAERRGLAAERGEDRGELPALVGPAVLAEPVEALARPRADVGDVLRVDA
eukprot:gene930-biopygen19710